MKSSAMLSPTSVKLLIENIDNYLEHLLSVDDIKSFISSHPHKVEQYVVELDKAIFGFNKFRILSKFPHKNYYKNSAQLDRVFGRDLPKLKTVFQKLELDHSPTHSVYSNLASDKYFDEVWQIRPIEHLLPNILLLIYRTTVLTINKELLIDSSGRRKVQISSVIEEMVFYYHLLGEEFEIFSAYKTWLDHWSEEGFSQQLCQAVKNNKNVLQYDI